MAARLYYLIGASGAGKDSLMRCARRALQGRGGVLFAHRYITRKLDPEAENHVSVSREEFRERLQGGCFALHWDSHGHRYGIGIEIDQWMALGFAVVVNGSRGHLDEARKRYPDLCPILIRVSIRRLRERLAARGRETPEQIEERLQRAAELDEKVRGMPGLVTVDNGGPLEEGGERLLRVLKPNSFL